MAMSSNAARGVGGPKPQRQLPEQFNEIPFHTAGIAQPSLSEKACETAAAKVKRNVLANGLQLAGFEVTPTGRFWVTPEAVGEGWRCSGENPTVYCLPPRGES